jgi:hypothetical protein
MDRGWPEWRSLQREAFGELAQVVMQTPAQAAIGTASADEARQTALAVAAHPSLGRAQRHCGRVGNLRQRHVLFEMGAELSSTTTISRKAVIVWLLLATTRVGVGHQCRSVVTHFDGRLLEFVKLAANALRKAIFAEAHLAEPASGFL